MRKKSEVGKRKSDVVKMKLILKFYYFQFFKKMKNVKKIIIFLVYELVCFLTMRRMK